MKVVWLGVFTILFGVSINAQSFNGYKYISTPKQFDGFSKPNQYRLNSYARTILKRKGFEIINNDLREWPADALKNPCLVLNFNTEKVKSVFKNKLKTSLTNCKKEVLIEKEGISSIKEFEKGYQEAIQKSLALYPLNGYFFDESLALSSSNSLTIPTETVALISEPKIESIDVTNNQNNVTQNSSKIFQHNSIILQEEIINNNKVLFVAKDNPNKILVRGKASSISGVYNVIYINQHNDEIKTLGYFENGNWVMDLPDSNNNEVKKVIFNLVK